MKFAKLTCPDPLHTPTWINPDHVVKVGTNKDEQGATILLSSSGIQRVTESPEEVIAILEGGPS